MNNNVSEGSAASQQVAQEIGEITEATDGLSASSQDVKTNADQLSALGDRLSELMGKFRV